MLPGVFCLHQVLALLGPVPLWVLAGDTPVHVVVLVPALVCRAVLHVKVLKNEFLCFLSFLESFHLTLRQAMSRL